MTATTQVLQELQLCDFDSGRMNVLADHAPTLVPLSPPQLIQLLKLFDYDSGKNSALRLLTRK
jgi:hypothetical protein